jgi:hypothetical protein
LIENKFNKLKKEYSSNIEKKESMIIFIFIAIFFLVIGIFFPQNNYHYYDFNYLGF